MPKIYLLFGLVAVAFLVIYNVSENFDTILQAYGESNGRQKPQLLDFFYKLGIKYNSGGRNDRARVEADEEIGEQNRCFSLFWVQSEKEHSVE